MADGERVLASRKQARAALGRDDTPGLFHGKPIRKAATPYVEPEAPERTAHVVLLPADAR